VIDSGRDSDMDENDDKIFQGKASLLDIEKLINLQDLGA